MRFLHTVLCKSRSYRTCYFEAEMKKERRHTPRELMEMTIEVMQQSVPEPRIDGKASPLIVIFAQHAEQKSSEPDWVELKRQRL